MLASPAHVLLKHLPRAKHLRIMHRHHQVAAYRMHSRIAGTQFGLVDSTLRNGTVVVSARPSFWCAPSRLFYAAGRAVIAITFSSRSTAPSHSHPTHSSFFF